MSWTQSYWPMGTVWLSALVAAVPVVVLLALLGIFHVRAHLAAAAGLAASVLIAVLIFRMPVRLAGAAAGYGAMYGLFPIGWIVLCAIFVYDITIATGRFEVLKRSIASIADDRRVQVLLIAFSFGAFIEGAAGFGTPVAISAAMLIGLGFKPRKAAGLALIGNTAPVAFGSLATPILALAKVTGLPAMALGAMVGRQLPLFSLIVPFWIVCTMCGWRRMREVWPACLTAGLSFGIVQFAVSNFVGPSLVDILASVTSILCLMILLRFWSPRDVWKFDHDSGAQPELAQPMMSVRETASAWLPWVVLSIFVFAWGIPAVKTAFNHLSAPDIRIAALDQKVWRSPPVVAAAFAEPAVFNFHWISATGSALLISGIVSGLLLGLRPITLARIFGKTLWRVRISLLTIVAMLALGFVTRFGGLDATMGLAFAGTGKLFPFFSPLLGWLGVALTGSDTASNVLFGNLQQITARRVGISPLLAAASNSSGGVMGKMIDAQSIVVAGVATDQQGKEGQILRDVFFHSLALAVLVGLLVLLQAYVLKWMVP
jgi:lactate permease